MRHILVNTPQILLRAAARGIAAQEPARHRQVLIIFEIAMVRWSAEMPLFHPLAFVRSI